MALHSGVTILIVEGSPSEARASAEALRNMAVANHVEAIHGPADVIDRILSPNPPARAHLPDLVLLNLGVCLPSYQLIRDIRADARVSGIPIIVFAAAPDSAETAQCLRAGANAVIRAPIVFSEFSKTVSALGLQWMVVAPPQTDGASH